MPKHHDRRSDDAQWTKEPRSRSPRITRFGASGALTGAFAPLSYSFLPKQAICGSQPTAIYEPMT